MPLASLYNQVKESVVRVVAYTGTQQIGSGTGSVFDCGRKVLTCAHCIVPGSTVGIEDPSKPGTVIPGFIILEDQTRDIAILKFRQPVGAPVAFSNSSSCQIGNGAFTVGFPMNIQEQTLLSAHIASLPPDAIRIDASINHGNSGGPLFNLKGEQVGVVNAKHGNLSSFLGEIESAKQGAQVLIGTVNPVEAIKQLIREMKRNLNLGIGYAIPTEVIKNLHADLGRCIP